MCALLGVDSLRAGLAEGNRIFFRFWEAYTDSAMTWCALEHANCLSSGGMGAGWLWVACTQHIPWRKINGISSGALPIAKNSAHRLPVTLVSDQHLHWQSGGLEISNKERSSCETTTNLHRAPRGFKWALGLKPDFSADYTEIHQD